MSHYMNDNLVWIPPRIKIGIKITHGGFIGEILKINTYGRKGKEAGLGRGKILGDVISNKCLGADL